MSRKKRFDFCILFYNDHYYIPFGNIHTGPKGDLYIGFGKGGEHFSFHSSLQVNYTDPDGVKTILNKRGDSKFYKDTLKNTFEPYQELNVPQRNLISKKEVIYAGLISFYVSVLITFLHFVLSHHFF